VVFASPASIFCQCRQCMLPYSAAFSSVIPARSRRRRTLRASRRRRACSLRISLGGREPPSAGGTCTTNGKLRRFPWRRTRHTCLMFDVPHSEARGAGSRERAHAFSLLQHGASCDRTEHRTVTVTPPPGQNRTIRSRPAMPPRG
jgi:hypothetical protein